MHKRNSTISTNSLPALWDTFGTLLGQFWDRLTADMNWLMRNSFAVPARIFFFFIRSLNHCDKKGCTDSARAIKIDLIAANAANSLFAGPVKHIKQLSGAWKTPGRLSHMFHALSRVLLLIRMMSTTKYSDRFAINSCASALVSVVICPALFRKTT